jgi:hypothetical protein
LIHNVIGTFTNCNRNKENNPRDVGIAYILSGSIYGILGIFGAIGIAVNLMVMQGKKSHKPINYS